jgi:hypothetical protein
MGITDNSDRINIMGIGQCELGGTSEDTLATPQYVRYRIDDFVGTRANDGTAFAIGYRNTNQRLVINYQNTSALLCTKYGNFDFNELDFESFEEVELNGVVFKKIKEV